MSDIIKESTLKETHNIIASRVPGAEGIDIYEDDHDRLASDDTLKKINEKLGPMLSAIASGSAAPYTGDVSDIYTHE